MSYSPNAGVGADVSMLPDNQRHSSRHAVIQVTYETIFLDYVLHYDSPHIQLKSCITMLAECSL